MDLYISFNTPDITEEEVEDQIYELSSDLEDIDCIEAIEPVYEKSPPSGAKGLSIGTGTILVKMIESGGISAVAATVGNWLGRDRTRTLKLQLGDKSLELTGLSQTEQQDMVEWFKEQSKFYIDR